MKTISDLQSRFDKLSGAKDNLESQLQEAKNKFRDYRSELRHASRAHAIIQLVSQQTQQQLSYQLSELPKLALSSIFDDPYEFQVEFELRRSKVEVDFWFIRDQARITPKENSGLGSVDIAGMALRPALWSLQTPRSRACLWLDEPFKHLKGEDANRRTLTLLAEICKPRPEQNWPGIQIIMIADERASREDLLDVADAVYEFSTVGRKTKVKKLK